MCLTKIPTHGIFKLLLVIYFQNMCIVTCDFFLENISALLCFLLRFRYCCSGIKLLEKSNSVINCIMTVPDCDLPKGAKLSKFVNYW